VFTYVEDKDLLKTTDGHSWKGPQAIEGKVERKLICQSNCILIHFAYEEVQKQQAQILEGFSSKKDRDDQESFSKFMSKYARTDPREDEK